MKNTYYFPHDYHARHDPKLNKLFLTYGYEGIGIYWCVIEMLYEQGGYLSMADLKLYSNGNDDLYVRMKNVLGDFGLFEHDETDYWSPSCLKRLEVITERSKKAKKSANSRWIDANAMPTQCDGNAIKEKKEEDKKGDTKPVLLFFGEVYQNKFKQPYVINWAKDGAIAKRLLGVLTFEELKGLILRFMEMTDPFVKSAGYTMGVFSSQINKLRTQPVKKEMPTL